MPSIAGIARSTSAPICALICRSSSSLIAITSVALSPLRVAKFFILLMRSRHRLCGALDRGDDPTLIHDVHTTDGVERVDGTAIAARDVVDDLTDAMTWLSYPGRTNATAAAEANSQTPVSDRQGVVATTRRGSGGAAENAT
jgi:hypothetical protein